MKAAEGGRVAIFLSVEIVEEISRVLSYPKIERIYRAEGLRKSDLVEAVIKAGKFVKPTTRVRVVEEHPADDKFIECALAAGAGCIVGGNRHLFKVASYKNVKILSMSDFLLAMDVE